MIYLFIIRKKGNGHSLSAQELQQVGNGQSRRDTSGSKL